MLSTKRVKIREMLDPSEKDEPPPKVNPDEVSESKMFKSKAKLDEEGDLDADGPSNRKKRWDRYTFTNLDKLALKLNKL